jgi:hypothetical protein
MTRTAWHRLLMTIVVVFLVVAALSYVTSIVLAPSGGRSVAGLWDGWAMFGVVDFFVRPLGGQSGDADVMADAEAARTGNTPTQRAR